MQQKETINSITTLPLPPASEDHMEMDVYVRFMRHIRHVPNSREDIKILSSIQFTADMVHSSDAHVAKTLVDLGLRAARSAFPADFLKFADQSLLRNPWEIGGPSSALLALQEHWRKSDRNPFSCVDGSYTFSNPVLVRESL